MGYTLCQSSSSGVTSTANTDQFWRVCGNITVSTTEANSDSKFQNAGVLSGLYVVLFANSVAATSTFTLRKNAGDITQTVSVGSSATGDFEDTTHTDTIAAADKICLKTHPGAATGTYQLAVTSLVFSATTDTVTKLGTDRFTFATASTSTFINLHGGAASTTEANHKCRMRKAGSLKKLGIYVSGNRAQTTTVRSRKNGANGNLVVSVTGGGAAGWYEDTSNSDTISAGEDWNYSLTTGTGTDTLTVETISSEFISTTNDGICIISEPITGFTVADNTDRFFNISGKDDWSAAETSADTKIRKAFAMSELTTLVTANDVSSASTCDLRKGAASTVVTMSITGSTTGVFSDSTHTYTAATTDLMNSRLSVPSVAGSHNVTLRNIIVYTNLVASNNVSKTLTETTNISDSLTRLNSKFRTNTETVTITEATFTRLAAKNRALATETTTISDSIAKVRSRPRAPATQTVTISDSIARMAAKTRANTESTTIGETLTRQDTKNRALPTETVTVGSGTLTRVKGSMRSLATQTVTVGDSISRLAAKNRIISSVVSIGETLTRLAAKNRALATQTVASSDSVAALKGGGANNVVKTITETVNISEQLTRLASKFRSLATETTTISSSVTRLKASNRSLSESVTVGGGTLSRLAAKIRNPIENVTIGESLTRLTAKFRTISESTTIASSVTRTKGVSRTLATQTVTISDSIVRQCSKIRSKIETVVSGESLNRLSNKFRSISETVAVSDIVNRTKISGSAHNVVRTLVETVTISDSLIRSVYRDLRNRVATGGAGGRRLKRLIHRSFTLKHRSFKL